MGSLKEFSIGIGTGQLEMDPAATDFDHDSDDDDDTVIVEDDLEEEDPNERRAVVEDRLREDIRAADAARTGPEKLRAMEKIFSALRTDPATVWL